MEARRDPPSPDAGYGATWEAHVRRGVTVVGYEFDCVPAHATISAEAQAGSVATATRRAVGKMLRNPQLRWKRPRAFKLQVVVTK